MKIRLIGSKCAGHAQCHAVSPDLFPIDDEGFCVLEERTVDADDGAAARAGVAACPEQALVIEEGDD